MSIADCQQNTRIDLSRRILELSWRVSRHSPPMKPFIRFSRQAEAILTEGKSIEYRRFLWNFDDSLQKILLAMLKSIASPEEISRSCIERWMINLGPLAENSRAELRRFVETGKKPEFRCTPREEFILDRMQPGSRFLYLGCGAGKDCLRIARRGHNVVGIDTDCELIEVAKDWAQYTDSSFEPMCMDALSLDFPARSFDGFLLEFYGLQPALGQIVSLQSNLSEILSDNGKGFIVAPRKGYLAHLQRIASPYPKPMAQWLMQQALADYSASERDEFGERLVMGLYMRSHTLESLSLELGYAFDVVECQYEEHDPRYVMAVVKRKKEHDPSVLASKHFDSYRAESPVVAYGSESFHDIISKIDTVCQILGSHEKRLMGYFNAPEGSGKNPLVSVETEMPLLIRLLEDVFEQPAQRAAY